jgi:hypothetical protein
MTHTLKSRLALAALLALSACKLSVLGPTAMASEPLSRVRVAVTLDHLPADFDPPAQSLPQRLAIEVEEEAAQLLRARYRYLDWVTSSRQTPEMTFHGAVNLQIRETSEITGKIDLAVTIEIAGEAQPFLIGASPVYENENLPPPSAIAKETCDRGRRAVRSLLTGSDEFAEERTKRLHDAIKKVSIANEVSLEPATHRVRLHVSTLALQADLGTLFQAQVVNDVDGELAEGFVGLKPVVKHFLPPIDERQACDVTSHDLENAGAGRIQGNGWHDLIESWLNNARRVRVKVLVTNFVPREEPKRDVMP